MSPTSANAPQASPMPANATVYLIRHGEKPDKGKGLSPAGQARAAAYVKYFQSLKNPQGGLIKWDFLFASDDSDHSDRPVLTITPLAQALSKNIDSDYTDADFSALATEIQQNAGAAYTGSNLLICWHHGEVLALASALGASSSTLPASSNWPSKWSGEVFGWLLKIYYDGNGKIDLSNTQAVNEHLMPDDTIDPVYDN